MHIYVDLLKKRKKLKEGLAEVNKKILSKYSKIESAVGVVGLLEPTSSERPSKIRRTLLLEENEELFSPISCSTPHHASKRSRVKSHSPSNDHDKCKRKVELSVVISVDWASGMKTRALGSDLIPLGKSLIKGTYKQIAVAAWKGPGFRRGIVEVIKREINKECCSVCSREKPSILRKTSKEDMLDFSWKSLGNELEEKAPILQAILKSASRPLINEAKAENENQNETKWLPATCMAAAVLFKNRS